MEIAAAFVVAAVEVVGLGDADLRCRLAKGIEDLPTDARLLDAPLAAGAVRLVGAGREILAALEVGQHVVPRPAGVAELAPLVVVARLAAHVDHAVDRRAAAQHLAARVGEGAAVEAGLRLGLEAPVGASVAHAIEIADGNVDPDIVVAPARLEQQDADGRIGAQPVGQDAACRPGPDDHIVEASDVARATIAHCLPPLPATPPAAASFQHEDPNDTRSQCGRAASSDSSCPR